MNDRLIRASLPFLGSLELASRFLGLGWFEASFEFGIHRTVLQDGHESSFELGICRAVLQDVR